MTTSRALSADGTEIAYRTSGQGPPLVLVHGMTVDHTTWQRLLPYLAPHHTVHAVDRRGRGASGDGRDYELAREFEDVAAVVDAVASASASAVDLLGHSFGGLCAFGGAALTANVRRLVLYEGWPAPDPAAFAPPPEVVGRLERLRAVGDAAGLLEAFYREVVHLSAEEVRAVRALPAWPARVAVAHTVLRELQAERRTALDPAWAAAITVPTLLIVGGDSPDSLLGDPAGLAAALPDGRTVVLEGQQHLAYRAAPDVFAETVMGFLRPSPPTAVAGARRAAAPR